MKMIPPDSVLLTISLSVSTVSVSDMKTRLASSVGAAKGNFFNTAEAFDVPPLFPLME
jgi:hypothetical protein